MTFVKKICLFGGTGFVGSSIVKLLAKKGHEIKIATRNPFNEDVIELKSTVSDPGQIRLEKVNINSNEQVKNFIQDCDICINLIGILYEKSGNSFQRIHKDFVRDLVLAVKENKKIKHFIHFSSLGVKSNTDSKYLESKFQAEEIIKKELANYTIIKPSVVFGGGKNDFTNMFAKLANLFPIIPLAGATVKFAPVYVGDIALGIDKIIEDEIKNDTIEFVGNEIFTLEELIKIISNEIRSKNIILPIPSWLGRFQGRVLGLAPKPMLTLDQVKTLESGDNISTGSNKTLKDLGIEPQHIRKIIPNYLWRFRKEGQFAK
ncbi:MAG: complex I NDUFA9 subunit family protein [Pelagibacteraceae bacterium]|nr:complex I NDUFA9 subunit family protein [Pelagibacteraceae bacterium]